MLPIAALADYQTGLDAYSRGDFPTAMQEWREVTDGPPTAVSPGVFVEAHYAVAMLYWEGQGVAQDYRQAYHWLLRAANMNHAGAQAKLGYLYMDGKGIAQNHDQAFTWFSRAAKLGNADGLYNLGICYLYGWGTESDPTMAKQYLAAASALGDEAAEEALQQLLSSEPPPVGGRSAAELPGPETDVHPLGEDLPEAEDAGLESSAIKASQGDHPPFAAEAAPTEATPPEAAPPEAAPTVLPSVGGRSAAEAGLPSSIHDEAWILAQNPSHYTLQVIALSSREKTLSLVEGYEQLAPFALYTVQNNQRPLYVLVQGVYPDAESARAARDAFPNVIQNPDLLWIRQFGKIHRLIEP